MIELCYTSDKFTKRWCGIKNAKCVRFYLSEFGLGYNG